MSTEMRRCRRSGCTRPAGKRRGLCRRDYEAELASEVVIESPTGSWPTGEATDAHGVRWRPIVGHEDTYLVSEDGRVWSRPRRNTRGGELTQHLSEGYRSVHLGATASGRVHALMGAAFLAGPLPGETHVRHLDGDPFNNTIGNLAWGSSHDNQLDCIRHGRNGMLNRTHCPRRHLLEGANLKRSSLPSRGCRSCGNARSYLTYYHLSDDHMQRVSDAYYAKYMTRVAA